MTNIEQPKNAAIRDLTRAEIDNILGRNDVGRLAFSFHDRVDIEPINYVYKDGWIYGRTSKGSKLETIRHNMWVAFEVDELTGLFNWRSVVVKGAFYVMDPQPSRDPDPTDTAARDDAAYAEGVALLRSLLPDTLLSSDPAPFRHMVFRIHLDEVTGREAAPAVSPAQQ